MGTARNYSSHSGESPIVRASQNDVLHLDMTYHPPFCTLSELGDVDRYRHGYFEVSEGYLERCS